MTMNRSDPAVSIETSSLISDKETIAELQEERNMFAPQTDHSHRYCAELEQELREARQQLAALLDNFNMSSLSTDDPTIITDESIQRLQE